MKELIRRLKEVARAFRMEDQDFVHVVLPRSLAVISLMIAIIFAVRCSNQITTF